MPVSDKNIKRFERATAQLNKVIRDCKAENPGCKAYLDGSETFYLMTGEASIGDVGDMESIITETTLSAHGGDW